MKIRTGGTGSILIMALLVVFSCRGASALAIEAAESGGMLSITGSRIVVKYDLKSGVFDLTRADGTTVVCKGRAEAVVSSGGEKATITPAEATGLSWTSKKIGDEFGDGVEAAVLMPGGDKLPDFRHIFRVYEKQPFIVVLVSVENRSGKPVGIERLSPMIVDGNEDGGVFLGALPENIMVLENGHRNQFDFWVRFVEAPAGSDSNWSSVLYDTETGRVLVGGFLTQEVSLGSVLVSHKADASVKDERSGRLGLSGYHARAAFSPLRRVNPLESVASDPFFIGVAWENAFDMLETFGNAAGLANGVAPYKQDVPIFWDTWYSHHYENISEEVILRNLNIVAEQLAPYGLNTFELDAGWERSRGDWYNNGRFPKGLKYIADGIRGKGLRPAIWFAPFIATKDTPVYKEHPDWFLELDTFGKSLIPSDTRALDISNPEAQKWIGEVVRRITREWGFGMLKVDFTYYSLAGKNYYQRGRTRAEMFREAFRLIREAAGPDVYILAVGVPVGYHAGVVDAMRTGLDNAPRWGTESGYATQGMLPSYRDMARRYFLNGRVWINDPDVIYTGLESTSKRWNQPAQPRNELLAWISAVGLSGQLVEFADAPDSLDTEKLNLIRSILPVYKRSARPLDLFVKENPEILDLKTDAPVDGHVIGLFNWGESNGPEGPLVPDTRVIGIEFARIGMGPDTECHVYDFWGDRYVGKFKTGFSAELRPRSVLVAAVRPALDRPQFLATNRHITMGATDVKSVAWDAKSMSLNGLQSSVAGFDYHLSFAVPKGYKFKEAKLGEGAARTKLSDGGSILNLYFTPAKSGETKWQLLFSNNSSAE